MSNNIEPPILLSRLMIFVFASALVVLVVLILTLTRMFPLNRTQVFFLTTQPKINTEIQITDFTPSKENLETYKQAFIKEYIKSRNEIIPNASVMQRKWSNSEDGVINSWSTPEVYAGMQKTSMWAAYMNDVPDFEFRCPVEFTRIAPRTNDTYDASFTYFCTNNDGQTIKKDYTIRIRLEFGKIIKWANRLSNPLGIRVSEYDIESGNGDPLDFK